MNFPLEYGFGFTPFIMQYSSSTDFLNKLVIAVLIFSLIHVFQDNLKKYFLGGSICFIHFILSLMVVVLLSNIRSEVFYIVYYVTFCRCNIEV